jgi:squalene-hopene/tetraprenyl-beta-curcumene cyclase
MSSKAAILMTVASIAAFTFSGLHAAGPKDPLGPDPAVLDQAIRRAVQYFRTQAQAADGSYSAQAGPAVTALVVKALLRTGRVTPQDPFIRRSLAYLEGFVQSDGGIYSKVGQHRNYETAICMTAFQQANVDGAYDELLDKGSQFLRSLQWDEAEGHDLSSPFYGGAGYGSHSRPDLSNTQFLIEALREAGNPADDPAIQKALVFVSRSQNLESEHNTLPFAPKVNDGGFYYTPAAGGQSQAGATANGGLRSYGSMTYAGLKSMIYAGLESDDPRVKAAREWIERHYTLAENPGMGLQGLFYYYHTFAKALDTVGLDYLTDADGVRHDWRKELAAELASRQLPDGSWVNPERRWLEGDPNLVTAYALLALTYCRRPVTAR